MAPVSGPRTASPVMVGRETELTALAGLARALRPGVPAVALVSGRAGMGKTRLVSEAARRWRDDGVRVLVSGCTPVEGTPYTPLLSALRSALPPTTPVVRMLTSGRAASRSELFESLGSALAGLSSRGPLMVVAEDLHWSDRATRDALTYLVTQADAGRWGVVGTHRYEGPVSAGELGSFADAIGRRVTVTRVDLEPLTPTQVAELAAGITGTRPTAEEADALHRRTAGIPLLVEEVLAAEGLGVPDHLRSMFLARVGEQGRDVAAVLQVVAVADECDELVVAEAIGMDPQAVAHALMRAREADLVVAHAAGYRFRHDLLREAVYDDIPPGHRRRLHRGVAGLLSARSDVDPAVLAEHWHLAGDREQAALASMSAARNAERMHAPAAAHGHYERVLAAWPMLTDEARHACAPWDELLRRAAYAAERSGDFARAAALTAERVAAAGGTAAEQALRWERLARYRWEAGDGHGSGAAYQEAVRVLPAKAPAAVRAKVLSGLAWHLAATFRSEEARPWSARALAAGEVVDDPAILWQVQLAQGIAWLATPTGHDHLEESCRLATAVGNGDRIALSRMWLNLSIQRLGRTGAREPNLRTAMRAAAADGLGSSMEAALRYMLAEYLCEAGRWDEASDELDHNLTRLHVTGIPALFSWGYLARLAAWRGDTIRADQALTRTRSLTELAPQQPVPLAAALSGRADSLLWKGRVGEAQASARQAVALASVSAYEAAEPLAALCRAEADDAERTRRDGRQPDPGVHADLSARLAALRNQPAPRAEAWAATCHAELARLAGERTAGPWRSAVEAWKAAADPYQEACARWRLAWALVADRSGRAEAAALLASAAEVAARLGARPLGDTVARSAVRWRLGLAGAARGDSGAGGLSARELELLPLLAAGRSNAEIAEILVISPRTVATHVSHILHKLGATRRAEVSDRAHQAGLLAD
jgi:DNA-binding CsgD family transcriptional regulator